MMMMGGSALVCMAFADEFGRTGFRVTFMRHGCMVDSLTRRCGH